MKLTAPLTLFGLIACILLVSAPHADHLPLLGERGVRGLAGMARLPHIQRQPAAIALAAARRHRRMRAWHRVTFHSLFGREVGVTLLILLVTLKLLELHSLRDATVLIYLSCFIIITNFFYSQSIPTALYMLSLCW